MNDPFSENADMEPFDPTKLVDKEDEGEDEEMNREATKVLTSKRKKRKMDHDLFFEDENGFKKMMKDFPKIPFKGKGNEFGDLQTLMRSYRQWFAALAPNGDEFETHIWTAKTSLMKPEKDKDTSVVKSDPRERLVQLRCAYKHPTEQPEPTRAQPTPGLSEEQRHRIAENRYKALQKKYERDLEKYERDLETWRSTSEKAKEENTDLPTAPVPPVCPVPPVPPAPAASSSGAPAAENMDMELQWQIEENRQNALQKKKEREEREKAPVVADAFDEFGFDGELQDDFGFDGGFDDM